MNLFNFRNAVLPLAPPMEMEGHKFKIFMEAALDFTMPESNPFENILSYAEEVVTREELLQLEEVQGRSAYIGFEPSGLLTVGNYLITSRMVNLLLDAGFRVTIFLADWHAYINDKLGGDIERIRKCGKYMAEAFRFSAGERNGINTVFASDLMGREDYWTTLIRIAKQLSLSRVKRALTIMGRNEDEAELDSSKMLYPLMQVTDIFMLGVDMAYGGMDQRKAHMLARDAAAALKMRKPTAVHTPLISSLRGGNRMNPGENKMSKSDPSGAIYIHDSEESIREKLANAYCPQGEEDNPVLDICRHILFPYLTHVTVEREEKFGGDVIYSSYAEMAADYASRRLHPADLKRATAGALWKILQPVNRHFGEREELLSAFISHVRE